MSRRVRSWGVPNTDMTLPREHVLRLLAKPGVVGTLLVAPSGYGKSVAAAQYAARIDHLVIWVPLRQRPAEPATLLEATSFSLAHLSRGRGFRPDTRLNAADAADCCRQLLAAHGRAGVLLVLDGCAPPREGSLVRNVMDLYEALSPFIVECVITCRSVSREDLRASRGLTVVDRKELAFSREEALRMANQSVSTSLSEEDVLRATDASRGHPALLRMILEHTDTAQSGLTDEPGLAITALLSS